MHGALATSGHLRPIGWPSNLPNLDLSSSATFSGLDRWIGAMTDKHKQISIMHIFGIDHRERSLEPWEWVNIVPVLAVFQAYSMAVNQQSLFRDVVVCTSNPGAPSGEPPDEDNQGAFKAPGITWPPNLPEAWIPDIDGMPHPVGRDGATPNGTKAVGGPTSDVGDPEIPGYCYLRLFRAEHRHRVCQLARKNPWGSAVSAQLLAEPGIWSPDKFTLTFGGKRVTAEGPNYTQAHVVSDPEGCKVGDLISRLGGTMRLGMATSDLNAMVGALPQADVPSAGLAFDERPDKPGVRLSIGISAIVGANQSQYPNFAWTVFSTPMMVAMLGIYESVRLVDASFNITLDQGASNQLFCAITSAGDTISGNEWYSAPVNKVVHGSDQGAVNSVFALPAKHSFAVEIRSRLPGNSPPVFHFGFGSGGAPEAKAVLGGHITVICAGQALMSFVNIGGDGNTKKGRLSQDRKMRRQVKSIQEGLDYEVEVDMPVVGGFDDSESDEDDEEKPAQARPVHRPSPPAGVAKTAAR